jgi:hypothetical protein
MEDNNTFPGDDLVLSSTIATRSVDNHLGPKCVVPHGWFPEYGIRDPLKIHTEWGKDNWIHPSRYMPNI